MLATAASDSRLRWFLAMGALVSLIAAWALLLPVSVEAETEGGFSPTGPLVTARSGHTATLLPNGQVLVIGTEASSKVAELYDPATEAWTATGSMATARYGHTATLLPDGKVLVAGGDRQYQL